MQQFNIVAIREEQCTRIKAVVMGIGLYEINIQPLDEASFNLLNRLFSEMVASNDRMQALIEVEKQNILKKLMEDSKRRRMTTNQLVDESMKRLGL